MDEIREINKERYSFEINRIRELAVDYYNASLEGNRRLMDEKSNEVINLSLGRIRSISSKLLYSSYHFKNGSLSLKSLKGIVEVDDLVNEGVLALIEALGRYNPKEDNISILTGLGIADRICKSVKSNYAGFMRLPSRKRDILDRIVIKSGNRKEVIEEIKNQLNIDDWKAEIYYALSISIYKELNSPDWEGNRESYESRLLTKLESPAEEIDMGIAGEKIDCLLDSLPDRERKIIKYRHEENLSYRKIGKILGLSQEGVRKLEKDILHQLKRDLRNSGLDELLIA